MYRILKSRWEHAQNCICGSFIEEEEEEEVTKNQGANNKYWAGINKCIARLT
jgi:hypothetical protein